MSASPSRHLWTIVLAGGDGVRLRQLTRALHGEERPKQFAFIHSGRSLLQHTLERAARWSEPARTLVVVAEEREAMARTQLRDYGPLDVVVQPSNRGTGPGLLLPLARIQALDPSAHVVVLPSDHYVENEEPFAQTIDRAVLASEEQIALVGAVPDHPETQYGWIAPGGPPSGGRDTISRFYEKPAEPVARQLLREGALWNTFIMAGKARDFHSLSSEHLPLQSALFDAYRAVVGTPQQWRVLRDIYVSMPVADFSKDVLQKAKDLRLVPLSECGWSDWGTPERVIESLRNHRDHAALSRRLASLAARAPVPARRAQAN